MNSKNIVFQHLIVVVLSLFGVYGQSQMVQAAESSPEQRFFEASRRGDIEQLKALIKQGVSVHSKDIDGNTALTSALLARQIKAMEYLLSQGGKISTKDATEWLVFIHDNYDKRNAFSDERRLELARLFLKWGANPNFQKHQFREPVLIKAIKYDDLELVRLLLDSGAQVNYQDPKGKTVLQYAVRHSNKNLRILKLLLSRGADANLRDSQGLTALTWAVNFGSYDTVKALLEFRRCFLFPVVDINMIYRGKYRILDDAKSPEIKALLLIHGAKPGLVFMKKGS